MPREVIDRPDPISKAWYVNASFFIATDIIILLLPMPLVSTLQVPYMQKAALAALFAIGIFVIFTSCMRMTTLNITATTSDVTFDVASTMWSIIEMNVAIICACLPMVRTFIVRLFLRKNFVGTWNDSLSRRAVVGESGSETYILGHNRHPNVHGSAEGDVTASPSPDLRRTSGILKTVQYSVE